MTSAIVGETFSILCCGCLNYKISQGSRQKNFTISFVTQDEEELNMEVFGAVGFSGELSLQSTVLNIAFLC